MDAPLSIKELQHRQNFEKSCLSGGCPVLSSLKTTSRTTLPGCRGQSSGMSSALPVIIGSMISTPLMMTSIPVIFVDDPIRGLGDDPIRDADDLHLGGLVDVHLAVAGRMSRSGGMSGTR